MIVQQKILVEKREQSLFPFLFHTTSTKWQYKVVLLPPIPRACTKVVPTCHCVQFFNHFLTFLKCIYFPQLVLSSICLHGFILPLLSFFLYPFSFFVFGLKCFCFLIIMETFNINNNHSFKRRLYNMFQNPASLDSCWKRLHEDGLVLKTL